MNKSVAISKDFDLETEIVSEKTRQKRLGQFFTGTALSQLLAALSNADKARSILDPMAGIGDMLVACKGIGADKATYGAIEIDHKAIETFKAKVSWFHPILGNAFDPKIISKLPLEQWDLVITNPPYVRYQSMSKKDAIDVHSPTSLEVRNNLIATIENIKALDTDDRKLFKELAVGYSGLSDLAVPSWILCAALCAPGSKLAIVLPESWLSRNYASIVQYMLFRWFKIHYIIEDGNASWFHNAQVKTTLLIAERIYRKESAFDWASEDKFLRVKISEDARSADSLVDKIFPTSKVRPEMKFAKMLSEILISKKNFKSKFVDAELVSFSSAAENLLRFCKGQKWLSKLENITQSSSFYKESLETYILPNSLNKWLLNLEANPNLTTLKALGVNIGQGLRTGANFFFYTTLFSENGEMVEIETSSMLGNIREVISADLVLPVLRKQSELPEKYVLNASNLIGRVLVINSWALPEDTSAIKDQSSGYKEIFTGPTKIIREAAKLNINGKPIWELSAVAPNIRVGQLSRNTPPRFWYMLPELTSRHKPDLFVARVNSGRPRTFLNMNRQAVVDANFSTLWIDKNSKVDVWAILAILNSTWCWAAIELSASVMGGGALKVEATHLQKLPIPAFSLKEWKYLSKLGQMLGKKNSESALNSINTFVASKLLGHRANEEDCKKLEELAQNKKHQRQSHKQYQ